TPPQDATSLQSLIYYLGVLELARFYRRKIMVLAQGIGPLTRGISKALVRRALSRVDAVTVRDPESAELLSGLGVQSTVTADPALLLSPGKSPIDTTDMVVLALRDWHAPGLREAVRALAERLPAPLLLVAMHYPEDLAVAESLGVGTVQPSRWTPAETLAAIAGCRMVIGMRLHALIFAASAGVPCVGLSYDPKVESFLASVGQPCVSLAELSSLPDAALSAWERREELAAALPDLRPAAAENFRALEELLR
ncbi:MAG: polysaccharide pyruvyl transferase family protein, partial [Armatimonadota bacterium]